MTDPASPMTTGQVAAVFGVTISTVKRWAEAGLIPYFRTPGGHYRFHPDDIEKFKQSSTPTVGVAAS